MPAALKVLAGSSKVWFACICIVVVGVLVYAHQASVEQLISVIKILGSAVIGGRAVEGVGEAIARAFAAQAQPLALPATPSGPAAS